MLQFSCMVFALGAGLLLLLFADQAPGSLARRDGALNLLGGTFLLSMCVIAYCSITTRMKFSLQIVAIYFAVFLTLPGYHHMSMNTFPFYDMRYPYNIQMGGALIVSIFFVTSIIAYLITDRITPKVYAAPTRPDRDFLKIRPNPYLAAALLVMAAVGTLILLSSVGLEGAFVARGQGAAGEGGTETATLGLARSLPRAMAFISFLYALILCRFGISRGMAIGLLLLNLPFMMICNWPLGLARFVVFGYLLLIVMVLFDLRSVKARIILSAGFVLGALGLMPFFNAITRGGRGISETDYAGLLDSYFESGDFDGMQSVLNAVYYVERYGLSWGKQLLSALFFFVPRSIWVGKGEPTGSVTAEAAGYTFLNISQPLPSEFYVDFGMTGVVFGAILVGALLARIDRAINVGWDDGPASRLLAGLVLAYSIILFRGSLLGVIATVAVVTFGGIVISRWGMRPAVPRVGLKLVAAPATTGLS